MSSCVFGGWRAPLTNNNKKKSKSLKLLSGGVWRGGWKSQKNDSKRDISHFPGASRTHTLLKVHVISWGRKKKFAQSKVSISGCPVSTAQRAMYEWIGWRSKWRKKKCSVDKPPQNLLLFYTVSDGKSYPLPPTQSKGWLTRPTQASFGDGSRERRQKFVLARKYGENSISSVFFQLQECYQNNNKFSIAWGR